MMFESMDSIVVGALVYVSNGKAYLTSDNLLYYRIGTTMTAAGPGQAIRVHVHSDTRSDLDVIYLRAAADAWMLDVNDSTVNYLFEKCKQTVLTQHSLEANTRLLMNACARDDTYPGADLLSKVIISYAMRTGKTLYTLDELEQLYDRTTTATPGRR